MPQQYHKPKSKQIHGAKGRGRNAHQQDHQAPTSSDEPLSPLENLKERLSSPRLRSPRTLEDYLLTSRQFLRWRGNERPPTEHDWRQYFIYERERGISERTLRKVFFQLKKLAEANDWDWTFSEEEAPIDRNKPSEPAHTIEEVEQLVMARHLYTRSEAFYLAVATTWGSRREELVTIKKRDYNESFIKLLIAKRHVYVDHVLPAAILPVMEAYSPSVESLAGMSEMYHRICRKAGVRHEKGWGWHCVRRMVKTALEWALAANRRPMSWAADYLSWSKEARGAYYSGSTMAGVYDHSDAATNDPWYPEKVIISIHPFLKCWLKAPAKAQVDKK